jgi:hypothetical protein
MHCITFVACAVLLSGPTATPQQTTQPLTTAQLATTHSSLSVLFEYDGPGQTCGGTCGRYRLYVTFRGRAALAQAEAADWRRVAESGCMDVHVQQANDFMCAHTRRLAGRDKSGTDYVLLRFGTNRAQLAAIAADPTTKFNLGGVEFRLSQDTRSALDLWLQRVALK